MNHSSPIRAGFAAIHQKPMVVAIEIAWRWTFGLIATVLLWLGARAFAAGLRLSEGDEQALRGHDPTTIVASLMHILQQPGVLQNFFSIAATIAIPSAVIWIAAATLGRVATLKKLTGISDVNAKAIFAFTTARVILLIGAVLAWYAWMLVCAAITMASAEPNYPLYLLLSMLALPVIALIWGLLNWLLSLAPVCAIRNNGGPWEVYRKTVQRVRERRSEFISISSWLGLPRLFAMGIALTIAIIFLVAIDSVLAGSVALTLITLAYCAFADYLYVVRLAAYAQIARELPIATAATPL